MRESDIESYLKQRVKSLGGQTRKARWLDRTGSPDQLVLLPGRFPFMVELKATGKKPDAHQAREHKVLEGFGLKVFVVDSLAGVEEILK